MLVCSRLFSRAWIEFVFNESVLQIKVMPIEVVSPSEFWVHVVDDPTLQGLPDLMLKLNEHYNCKAGNKTEYR